MKETHRKDINLESTLSLCLGPVGKQLSTFLIEHGYAAERNNNTTPSEQEIRKSESLSGLQLSSILYQRKP